MRSHYQIGYRGGIIKRFATRFINLTTATLFFATTFAGAAPLLFPATASAAGTNDVWITAAMPDPSPSDPEYVTLKNVSTSPVNLNGWKVDNHAITAPGDLAAGDSATVCENGKTASICTTGYSISTPGLNNNGDIVTLYDNAGNQIDRVSYAASQVGVAITFSHNTPAPTIQACTTTNTTETTNLSTWTLSETRANGHNALVANGLHIWTDGATDTGDNGNGGTWNTDKAAGYYPASFNLADLGEGFGVTTSSGSGTLPSLQLLVDLDNDGHPEGYLVGEPASYGADSLWLSSNWTGLDISSAPVTFNGGGTGKGGSINAWLAAFPNAKVSTIGYSLGSGVHGDYVISKIFAGCTNYTFKSLPVASPVMPNVPGEVIYNSISSPLPASYPSQGFEATSTSALGDKITFAGTDRNLDKAAVTLNSWACEKGSWTNGCITTPGATFSQPVTLNIYNVANDGSVGSLVKSVSQTFNVPYRPTTDPTCPTNTNWRDANGDCHSGYNYVAVFDLDGVTAPDTVIYSVAFNTQHYGADPAGANGPYDSLNVGLNADSSAPYVGTDTVPDEIYWDSTYLGRTAGLTPDTGWSPYQVAAMFTAKPADTTAPSVPTLVSPVDRGYTKTNDFYFDWTNSTDDSGQPVTYEFQSSQNPHTANGVLDTNAWNNIANGNSEQKNLTSSQIHSTGAPDGTWYWQVRAIDAVGNKSAWTPVWHMTIDTQAPTTTLNVQNLSNGYVNSRQYGDKLTVTGHATDKLGMNRVLVQLLTSKHGAIKNHTVYLSGTNQDWSTDFNIKQLGLVDGNYSVVAVVTDNAGNTSIKGQYLDFTLDNTKPLATFTSVTANPTPNGYYNNDFQVGYDVSDNYKLNSVNVSLFDTDSSHSNHWSTNCYNQSSETGSNDSGTCTVQVSNKTMAQLPDGKYYVAIQGQDAAGLWTVAASRTIYIDRTAPSNITAMYTGGLSDVTTPTPVAGKTLGGNLVFHISEAEANPSYMYAEINWLNPSTNKWEKHSGWGTAITTDSATLSLPASAPSGTYQIKVSRISDKAGNTATTQTFGFTVDNTAPAAPTNLSWLDVNGNPANNGFTNVQRGNLSWQDPDTSTNHYVYKFWTNILGYFSDANNPWTTDDPNYFTPTSDGSSIWTDFDNKEGTYFFCVEAVDAVGNTSVCSNTYSVAYDKTAPDAPKLVSPKDGVVLNGASITQSWSDSSNDVDHYIYESYNDAAATHLRWHEEFNGTSKSATKVKEATYWWRVAAVDHAGNVSDWSPIWKITVDNTAPAAPSVSPADGSTVNDKQIVVTVDPGAGNTANVTFTDQNSNTLSFTDNNDGTYTVVTAGITRLNVSATAEDTAINVSPATTASYGIATTLTIDPILASTDTTPTITGTTGNSDDVVTVDGNPATVNPTQNADGSYNWTYTPSTPFAIGDTTINVVSKDTASNATSQSALVKVNPTRITLASTSTSAAPTSTLTLTPASTTTPQVLGVQTNTSSNQTSNASDVKGDSTTKDLKTNSNKVDNSGAFLGLGWWWLLIVAVVLGLWWLLAARRRADDDK